MKNNFALEPGCDGEMIGRDPRKMSIAELEQLGHSRMSPMKAIRARCLSCCVDSADEVKKCTALECPSWPYRMGENPFRNKTVYDDARKASLGSHLRRLRGRDDG